MSVVRQIGGIYSAWMDGVAASAVAMLGRFAVPSSVRLVEQDNGRFAGPRGEAITFSRGVAECSPATAAMLNGSRVELALRADRFFFRPLEVPRRAADFLSGMVQTQIDRITPWAANEAVFGWSAPAEIATDRISVTVAAAPRAQIAPLTQALAELGVRSVVVTTTAPDETAVKVLDQSGATEHSGIRRKLAAALLAMIALAVLAAAADIVVGNDLHRRQNEVSQRIAERRGLILAGNEAVANSALAQLERRKKESAASVIVLEALSNVLPDNTYVTDLRVEGDKVQVVGFTQDAPSLIRLIERSPHFSRATFFAPTTRAPSDPGDRFHIEAQIKPVFSPPS